MGIFRVLVVLLIITLVAPDSMAVVRRQKNKLTKADYENMYLTFDMGGGLYTYRYKVDGKKQNVKPGGTMNICFNQFFPKGFGYGVGLGASYYGAATTFSALETVEVTDYDVHKYDPDFMTGEPETYTFKTQFNNISERQHLVQFEVPVMGMYKLKDMVEKWDLTVALGAKLGVPLMKRFKVTKGDYETSGYFNSTNVEYSNLPQHKFTDSESLPKGKSNLSVVSCNLFLDAGCNYHIDRGRTVYFGLFFTYCITNISKTGGGTVVDVNDLSYNGVLGSSLVDKAHLMGAGAKVQLCLDFNRVRAIFKGSGRRRTGPYRSTRSIF